MSSCELRQQVLGLADEVYGAELCHSWPDKYPDFVTLKHPVNHKWFGLVARVPGHFIGLDGPDRVWILNVKGDSALIASLLSQEGFHPAWHMNKEHWVTLRLDGSVPFEQIQALLDMSFQLVAPRRRKVK